jgi:uncharacterized protein DUF3306
MSDLEDSARNFLRRWSQRKRAAEKRAPDGADSSPEDKEAETNAAAQGEADLPTFDPATLPQIESITATSDIRAFLAPGVPEELMRAALRRIWMTDPTIRDFIGIAENQWDFTRPGGVPGFGSLELTPELLRMVASLIGDAPGKATRRQENAVPVKQVTEISEQLPPARTLAPREDDSSSKRSFARTNVATSAAANPDPLRVVPQRKNNDSVAKKSIYNADEGSRSLRRKHGGAVPK